MAFNWDLRVPYGYNNSYVTLRWLEQRMKPVYHPEYVRRFLAWLHYHNGYVGAGGLDRTIQPNKPGFAPTLQQSFHWLGQEYSDGKVGACAVDTVVKDGPDDGDWHDGIPWSAVPTQGSAEAARWGVHANVGTPVNGGESWHIQPVEIDGHGSWVTAGKPAPVADYPIPSEHDPYPKETIVEPFYFTLKPSPAALYVVENGSSGTYAIYVDTDEWVRRGQPTPVQLSPEAARRYIYAYPVPEGVVV